MDILTEGFQDRLREIEAYLDLLDNLEQQVQDGPPRIGTAGPVITALQQKILYSSVFVQLYNLVEATVTRCLNAVSEAAAQSGRWQPGDLADDLRRDWVRVKARTHVELHPEKRLDGAFAMCEHLIHMLPVSAWEISRGGGGSWDDLAIEDLCQRLGLALDITDTVKTRVKRHFRDDRGAMVYVKTFRNWLAHGNISFAEGGENLTVADLRELTAGTSLYLGEVVARFRAYIDGYEFLVPNRRPAISGSGTSA